MWTRSADDQLLRSAPQKVSAKVTFSGPSDCRFHPSLFQVLQISSRNRISAELKRALADLRQPPSLLRGRSSSFFAPTKPSRLPSQ